MIWAFEQYQTPAVIPWVECDPRIHPRFKARKPSKRPALRGVVIRAGRLVLYQPPRIIFCIVVPKSQGQNCALPQSRTRGPTPRFTPSEMLRMPPAPQEGHKPPHNAKQGPSRF